MDNDLPARAVQEACEELGYEDLRDVDPNDYDELFDLAERLSD